MAANNLFFLIAGEASGDLLGAALIRALRKRDAAVRFTGVGGPRMRAEGMNSLFPQEELAHMGILELLRHIPNILRRVRQCATTAAEVKPAALITIDAPDFSFRVAKKLVGKGIPLIHYVAPTVWAWRPGRAKKVAAFLTHLMALLPFEPPYFTKEGLGCTFVGHPIVESGAAAGDGRRFRAKHHLTPNDVLITLLPGSRAGEIKRLLPIFESTVRILANRYPNLRLVLPAVPHLLETLRRELKDWPVRVILTEGDDDKYDALAASQVALACSGTVALELAMARLPAVIAYRANALSAFIARHLLTIKYANLVNLMHDRMVVPEYIQENCTPENLAAGINDILRNEEHRLAQQNGLIAVASWLGQGEFIPSERAADTVLGVVNGTITSPPKSAVL
jgi:lipid-A-disaccharide synthase